MPGCRNRATIAAAALLAGEAEGVTRKAVEMALAGDAIALRLCLDRLLPPCREQCIEFDLPSLAGTGTGSTRGPSPDDVALAMNAVLAGLARGEIAPGEAERIAGAVRTFVGAFETAKKAHSPFNMLSLLAADDDGEDDFEEENGADDGGEPGHDDR